MSSLPEIPFSGFALSSSTNIIFFIDIGPLRGLFRGVVEEKQREELHRLLSRHACAQRPCCSGLRSFGGEITTLNAKW